MYIIVDLYAWQIITNPFNRFLQCLYLEYEVYIFSKVPLNISETFLLCN